MPSKTITSAEQWQTVVQTTIKHESVTFSHLVHEADAEGGRAGAAASEALQQQFSLSKEQAEGVLNMSLRRLTSLEANRLQEESQQLHARFAAHYHAPHAIKLGMTQTYDHIYAKLLYDAGSTLKYQPVVDAASRLSDFGISSRVHGPALHADLSGLQSRVAESTF